MRIDLHTHSSVSDGTATPSELVEQAAAAGLDVVALTDHDTFDGLDEARAEADRHQLELVPGVEISCQLDGHSVHLLAYWADPDDPSLAAELARSRQGRTGRVEAMAARLTALGMPITADEIVAAANGSPSIGRPHVADVLVAKGYVADRNQAFSQWLADGKPGYVTRYASPLAEAIDLVHGAGGAAVIAHPWGRGRVEQLPPEVLAGFIADHHLDGIEVDHQDHDPQTRQRLWSQVEDWGVVGTGSSDHHGTGKVDHELGCNLTRLEQWAALRARAELWSGRRG